MVRRDLRVFENCAESVVVGSPVKKKKNRALQIVHSTTNDRVQRSLMDEYLRDIDPAIFFDPNIMCLTPGIIKNIVDLNIGMSGIHIPKSTRYIVTRQGNNFVLRTTAERILAIGTPGQLFGYMSKYAIGAISTLRAYIRHIDYKPTVTDLSDYVNECRMDRACAPGLERLTKMYQNRGVDFDSVLLKFYFLHNETRNTICYHYGSGDNISGSVIGLLGHYDKVICVDPRLHTMPNYIKGTFEENPPPKNVDVVSDIAYGDIYGMNFDYVDLAVQLYNHARLGNFVVAKLPLDPTLKVKCFVLRKPRAHNMEIIVQLHPEGDSMSDIYNEYVETVKVANRERNDAIFKGSLPELYQKHLLTSGDIETLLVEPLLGKPNRPRYEETNALAVLRDKLGVDHNPRQVQLNNIIKRRLDQNYVAKKGSHVPIVSGVVSLSDPGFADIKYAADSIMLSVQTEGRFVIRGGLVHIQ